MFDKRLSFRERFFGGLICIPPLIAISACAIHPLPESASGVRTYDIANKIRCEAKSAVFSSLRAEIDRYSPPGTGDKVVELLNNPDAITDNSFYKYLDPKVRKDVEKYDGTAIAYDFTFEMTENNNINGGISLISNVFNGTDALGFKSTNNRERKNIRNFRLSDTFQNLFTNGPKCENYSGGINLIYPITGEVGLSEVIETFFALNETGALGNRIADKTTLFADTLTFTTVFTGSVSPQIVISPVGKALGLASASLTAEATRSDAHTLIVALSLPPELPPGEAKVSRAGPTVFRGKTAAEVQASRQIDYQIDKNRIIPFTGGAYLGSVSGPLF